MNNFSPISSWLDGKDSLPPFKYWEKIDPFLEFGAFLSLDICIPLHEALELPPQSLSNSWLRFKEYVEQALNIINADIDIDLGINLDNEERYLIKQALGIPPKHCYPIYIVTVGSDESEKIVYIGKTSSSVKRFAGGHKVALGLHDPKFNGLEKNIYWGCVVFLSKDKEYFPLEWIHPLDLSLSILDSVESELIFNFSPELNIMKKSKNFSKYPINLHIQNFTAKSKLLHDKFIWHY